jgi:hypothetical protein
MKDHVPDTIYNNDDMLKYNRLYTCVSKIIFKTYPSWNYLSFQKPNINNSETLTFQIALSNIETQT